jgi:nitroreductase
VIVVTERNTRRRLRELYQEPWNQYMIKTGGRAALDAGESSGLPAGRLRMLRGADDYAHTFDEVPVHLIVCVQLDALAITDAELARPSIVGGASVYPFVHNVLLGLRHEGLGASFTTLLIPAEPAIKELLGIPEGVAMAGHITVGHRADPWPKKLTRNPVSEFAFAEAYGTPFVVSS